MTAQKAVSSRSDPPASLCEALRARLAASKQPAALLLWRALQVCFVNLTTISNIINES